MSVYVTEPWYLRMSEELDAFCEKVEDKVEAQQQQLKACKKRTELENRLAQELKINSDLKKKLLELTDRDVELEQACSNYESRLTIAGNDKKRLDSAKENYELAKELTGIRLDFSAPPNTAKGYIKNKTRKLLLPFDMQENSDALWELVKTASDPSWPDKENNDPN